MTACEPLCGPLRGRAESLPLPKDTGRIWTIVPPLRRSAYPRYLSLSNRFTRDEKKSRIKAGGASGRSQLPAVRAVTGVFRSIKSGVRNSRRRSRLRSLSQNTYCHNKKQGARPGKEPLLSRKEKFSLYLTLEKKAIPERRYQEDGGRSLTAFIENAVDFYLDYLSANNAGLFLPASVKSCLDGRWDSWKIACLPCLQTGSGAGHGGWHPR